MKLTTTLLTLAAMTAASSAASIGLNFQRDNGASALGTTTSAGVVAQTNWNNSLDATSGGADLSIDGTIANLTDSNGSLSGIAVTWGGGDSWSSGTGTSNGDTTLNNGYLDSTNGGAGVNSTVAFTGISYASYDIYVYFGSDANNRTGIFSDGTTNYSFTTSLAAGNFTGPGNYVQTTDTTGGNPSSNYAVFTGLSNASTTITGINTGSNFGMTGIQIVDTTAVPEPSSTALLGLGGLALIMRRRK